MFRAVKQTLRYLSNGELRRFNWLLIGRCATAILDIIGVLLIGLIAATAAGTISSGGALTVMGIDLSAIVQPSNLLALAIITLGFFVLKALLAIWLTHLMTSFVARVESRTAAELTERILHGSLSKLERWSRSELTYSITYSMNAAFTRLLSHYATLITEGFLLVCIALVLLLVSPVTMVIVVVYFGAVGFTIQALVGKQHQSAGGKLADSTVASTDAMTESISTFREIFTLGRQDFFVSRFGAARTDMSDSSAKVQFIMTLPRYIVESSLLLGAVALIAAQVAFNDVTTAASTLGIFLTAGVRIMASLLPLQTAAGSMRQVSSEAKLAHRLLEDFASTEVPARSEQAHARKESVGLSVALSGINFTYNEAESPALRSVDFTAKAGEYTAIIGASGAGKSTLADLILGLLIPDSGTIELDGSSPRELDLTYPGSVAYVPQRPGLVSGTIADNVALGHATADIDYDRVEWALGEASLLEFVTTLPDGSRTSVGKQTSALSGGQVQRLGLARALYSMPRLLVLDEATSALDAESESVVGESLRRLYGKVTLVVIAHRLSTVQHADTVHVMEDGKIIAAGPFAHLLETVPVVARYAELMAIGDKP